MRCITFGSPRVGNRPFKKAFHSLVGTSLRLVYGRDPVPVLPPSLVYAPLPWSVVAHQLAWYIPAAGRLTGAT